MTSFYCFKAYKGEGVSENHQICAYVLYEWFLMKQTDAINIQTKRNNPILKTLIRNKHPHDYRLIDDIVGSAKT